MILTRINRKWATLTRLVLQRAV
jgi:hypothetical protein